MAESRLIDALDAVRGDAEPVRLEGIKRLVEEGLTHIRRRRVGPKTMMRARAIVPALFDALFDESRSVQIAAALGICALRKPGTYAPGGTLAASPDPSELRHDLEDFLADLHSELFSSVHVATCDMQGGTLHMELIVSVTDSLPLELAGQRPKTRRPQWVSQTPKLAAYVSSTDGDEIEARTTPEDDRSSLTSIRLSLAVDPTLHQELLVDVELEERTLNRHLVALDVEDTAVE